MPKYTSSCLVYVFTNRAPLSFCLWERPSVYVVLPDGSLIYIHTHVGFDEENEQSSLHSAHKELLWLA